MNVTVKPGAVIKELNSALCHVAYSVWFVWREYGLTAMLTSGNDSKHMEGSLHYKNLAWDFRIWGIPNPQEARDKLHKLLNTKGNDYDVVLESDHLHIEYDVKDVKLT
jgi:hypothetical protein